MMSKKTRGPNFSANEKEILIHLITKYKDLVENKKTDAVTTNLKNEGWRKLAEEFNSLSSFSVRNTDQLKTCWDNIKRNTRKDNARTKKEIILTGGGRPNLPPPGPYQGQVEVILGPTLDGLENPFDSDAQYVLDTSISESEFKVSQNSDMTLSGISTKEVPEYETTAGSSTLPDDSLMVVQKNQTTGPLKEDECLIIASEDSDGKMWNGWSPADLKTKVTDTLAVKKKKDCPLWLQRRRPKASLHDKLLESKLELVELMKKNAESEAKIKFLILEEQLKQEKIKTEKLQLQLQEAQHKN